MHLRNDSSGGLEMKELISQILKFRDDRNWGQFHTGANLAKSLSIEANEVLQLFQWQETCSDIEGLKEEVADVMIYALLLCDKYEMNPEEIISQKIKKNEKKYPIEKSFGKSDKYNKL